ncbi:MAG: CBS domain-containing protein [Sulfolobales archaeon]
MVPKVSSYMSSPVITADKEDPLTHVRNLMLTHKIGRVVITEHGRVIGIVCKSDFTKIVFNRKRYIKPLDTITVNEIMTTPVYAISPNKTLKSVAQFMLRHELGSLPVIDNNDRLVGIITKYDILKAFSSKFHNMFKVSDFMIKNPSTVSPNHSIYYVIDALLQSELKKLVVIDEDRPVGIITSGDVLDILLGAGSGSAIFRDVRRDFRVRYDLLKTHSFLIASDIMIRNPITVKEDEDLARASDIMIKNRISCLPVINSEGSLAGLLFRENIIKALREI